MATKALSARTAPRRRCCSTPTARCSTSTASALLAEQLFPGYGERLALLWRDKQIEYTRLTSMSRPLPAVLGADPRRPALSPRCAWAWRWTPPAEDQLMNQYRHLSAFPENSEVLHALKAARHPRRHPVSNGDPEMLGVAVKSAGFAGLLDPVLSVHAAQALQDRPAGLRARARRRWGCRRATSCSSPATAGTRSAPPGSATPRCGSTAPALPLEQLDTAADAHRQQPARRARLLPSPDPPLSTHRGPAP